MKNNFDDIIRNKWEQFHFPVDEDHRRDMIKLLDQNKRRKTGLFWWLGSLGTAVLLMAIVLFVMQSQPDTAPDTDAKPVNNSAHKSEYAVNDEISTEVKDDQDVDVKENIGNVVSPNQSQTPNEELQSSAISNEITNEKRETTQIKKPLQKTDNKKPGVAVNKTKGTTVIATNIEIEKTSSATIINNPVEANLDQAETNEVLIVATEKELNDAPILNTRKSSVTMPVETLPINLLDYTIQLDRNIEPLFVKHHSLGIFAEAGLGFIPGSEFHYNSGWAFNAGGGLDYEISNKLHLTLSSGYMLQKGGFEFEKFSNVTQSTFGLRSNINTLAPDKLHFVYAKLGIHYRSRRHIVSLSGGTQYLYGAQGDIVTQSQDELLGFTQNSKYSWLNIDGMQKFLWSTEAQYGYQLTPLLSLRAGVKYTFTPLEAVDTDLQDKGYYWNGAMSSFNPFFTIHFHLYGKR